MDIAVTGSTGFIGRALVHVLREQGHRVVPVVRGKVGDGTIGWDPTAGTIDRTGLEGIDAVVHLAGEGIASAPWTTAQRRRIHDSRSQGTAVIAEALSGLVRPPSVLVSGSAIGWYGDRGEEVLDETSRGGQDFLATVCRDWEAGTDPARQAGIRTALVRTGMVLDSQGGALAKQLLLFRLGLGGRMGSGRQWVSWITRQDEVSAIIHILKESSISGPVNLTSPNPVTNAEFTKALGSVLHRPTFVTVPRLVCRLPFGVGDLLRSLVFSSARVEPTKLSSSGFEFAHPTIDEALWSILAS